ncbi:S41 family peptidase [Winogradskyella sp.]|uniref:S41 family peptidase n=1 Tax=Winogradskyella sp. TaxID=1883156 RepID=UPI0026344490|nr:S41 family peptidase [Winogradskyella sp.]
MTKQIIIALLIVTLFSCKDSEKEKIEITKSELSGFFEQQGEGEIIEINDSTVVSYYSSSFNCYPNWKITRDYFNTETPNVKIIDKNTFTSEEGYTTFTYKKLNQKPEHCKVLTEIQKNSNTYNFETLWNTFNDQYAFFKERNIDWKQIKETYKTKFTDKTELFDFYITLENMVLELKDEHSDFEIPEEFDEQWHKLYRKKDTTDYEKLTINKILDSYVKQVKKYNGGQLAWGFISEDIAYIQLNGMDGLANYNATNADSYWEIAEESDDYFDDVIKGTHYITEKIVKDIQNTKNCIIDLRFNGGGYDSVGLAFMSHFINREYNIFKKKRRFGNSYAGEQTIDIKPSKNPYLKPVYLLTSPYTVSAAETTIIATMNFPNFKRVGSNTNGALSDLLVKELPNGWVYTLSNEVYESMDGKVYEVSGIPPDYPIDYPKDEDALFKTLSLELDNSDRAIEKAKELMK